MRYCFSQLRERGKMTIDRNFVDANISPGDWAQLKALQTVMNEIVNNKVPLVEPADLFTKKVIRELEAQKHDYLIDDGDLCSVIDMAVVELRVQRDMIKAMRDEVRKLDTKIAEQYSEIQRLERLAANAN